jgi:2-oxoglutarate ferredoxin oxidoreductase subunit beta
MSEERFKSEYVPQWCPGCGMFNLLDCVRQALEELYEPNEVILATGIGQTAKLGFSVRANLFNGLHGRALPLAMGMRMANRGAKILVVAGDGDLFAEGGNHFLHAMRRNLDVTVLAGDNRVFGLTKGQGAPTSDLDFRASLHKGGAAPRPINPTALALISGATFVAKTFSGNQEELTGLIGAGLQHKGMALIDVMFPCVSFNRINTVAWYNQRVREIGPEHDDGDFEAALRLATGMSGEEIPTGVYYRVERPIYTDLLAALEGAPLVERAAEWRPERVKGVLAGFR